MVLKYRERVRFRKYFISSQVGIFKYTCRDAVEYFIGTTYKTKCV